jgi:mannose-6-phosphate isomerase
MIMAEPTQALGEQVHARFGGRLPFLMKLLAAKEPLSLQVHPHRERAVRRFAEQMAAGIPINARERSYPDSSHKPEMIYALTRFEGMAGFRDASKSAAILRGLELNWVNEVADELEASHAQAALRDVVTTWLSWPSSEVGMRLAEVRAAALVAQHRVHGASRLRRPVLLNASEVARESVRVYAATVPLVERYPQDPGVLVALLLNHVVLAPGESMFINAGIVHAYTSGFGVEIMAASDNVVRAGLTAKHVDIPELLEVANFSPIDPPRWAPSPTHGGIRLSPPVEEFELLILDPQGERVTLEPGGPRLTICLRGEIELDTEGMHATFSQGQSAFIEAYGQPLTISGHGQVAVGQTPTPRPA